MVLVISKVKFVHVVIIVAPKMLQDYSGSVLS